MPISNNAFNIENPFHSHAHIQARSLSDRLAGRARPDLAELALDNLLAGEDPRTVSRSQVMEILSEYGVKGQDAEQVCSSLWRRSIDTLLETGVWSKGGKEYAEALRQPLGINDFENVAMPILQVWPKFGAVLEESLSAENILTFNIRDAGKVAQSWGIPEKTSQEMMESALKTAFNREVNDHTLQTLPSGEVRRRMSREDIQRMRAVGQVADWFLDRDWTERLYCEERWCDLADDFKLDTIDVSIRLFGGEVCVYECAADLLTTVRDKLQSVGGGTLYLTNDLDQLIRRVIGKVDRASKPRANARIRSEEHLHQVPVSSSDHDQVVSMVLHHL